MAQVDHYKVLGVSKNCSEDDLKKAYKSLAKQYHPDKNKESGAEDKFKEVSAAYDVLKDGEKRRTYDLQRETDELRAKREKEQATRKTSNSSGGGTTFTFSTPSGNSGNSFSFSQNGTNFTFKTTFSTFGANRDKKEENKKEDKNNNTSKKNKPKPTRTQQRSFDYSRPEWNSHFTEETASDEDGLPGMFRFSDPFKEMDSAFDIFLNDPFFDDGLRDIFGASGGMRNGKVKRVDNKKKKEKKDPMADMYDWTKPVFPGKRGHFEDEDYDFSYESDEDISKYLFPCSYCGRKFHSAEVHKHEEVCRRIYNGHPKAGDQFKPQQNKQKANAKTEESDAEDDLDQPGPRRSHDWRQEHEDLKTNVRQAKRAARAKKEAKVHAELECNWCGRLFDDEDVAETHFSFCKQRHDEPRNSRTYNSKTGQAKEYAKNVPKPKPAKPTSKGSHPSGKSYDDQEVNLGATGRAYTRTKSAGGQKTGQTGAGTGHNNYNAFHGRTSRKK